VSALISVLLPAHNAARTLRAALRSISRQRDVSWECIVIDDGSTDATADLAIDYARTEARVRVLTEPHRGIVGALNAGLAWCRGSITARMDADDCMHPDRLRAQRRALETDESLTGVGSQVRLFPRRQLTPGRLRYETWLNALTSRELLERDRFIECPLAHPTLAIRTDVLRAFAYRDCGWPEDYDLVLRLLEHGHRLTNLGRVLHAWRDHPGRLSRVSATYRLDAFMRARAHFLSRGFLRGMGTYTLWGYGPTARSLRTALGDYGIWPRNIVEVHPRRIGQTIHGAEVIGAQDLSRSVHAPLVSAVSGADAREEIRAALRREGWTEQEDFVCAA